MSSLYVLGLSRQTSHRPLAGFWIVALSLRQHVCAAANSERSAWGPSGSQLPKRRTLLGASPCTSDRHAGSLPRTGSAGRAEARGARKFLRKRANLAASARRIRAALPPSEGGCGWICHLPNPAGVTIAACVRPGRFPASRPDLTGGRLGPIGRRIGRCRAASPLACRRRSAPSDLGRER